MAAQTVASEASALSLEEEMAATQQSILEELHSISEEALHHHHDSNGPNSEYALPSLTHRPEERSVTPPDSCRISLETEPEEDSVGPSVLAAGAAIFEGIPAEEQQVNMPKLAAPQASTESQQSNAATDFAELALGTAAEIVAEISTEAMVSNEPAVAQERPVAEATAEIESGPEQTRNLPEQADGFTTEHPVVLTPVTSALMEAANLDDSLEHADLFDGIDEGAFDDVELSPPVYRHAPLPPIHDAVSDLALPSSKHRGKIPAMPVVVASDQYLEREDTPPEERPQPSQMVSFLDASFVGFQTGHGKKVKLSDRALEVARKLMMDLDESQELLRPLPASQPSLSQPPPSKPDAPNLGTDGSTTGPSQDRPPMREIAPKQTPITVGSEQAFPSKRDSAPTQIVSAEPSLPSSQADRPAFATPETIRSVFISGSQMVASPQRTPASVSTARFATPQSSKRVSLGTMPRVEIGGSTGRKRALPRFVTPFKGGKRPKNDDSDSPATPLRGFTSNRNQLAIPASMVNRHYPSPSRSASKTMTSTFDGPSVFNLTRSAPRRKLSAVGKPESVSALQMIAKGVPDEILVILRQPSRASQYAFESPSGELLMQGQALQELLGRGCPSATLPWVQNHWTLILWKLAAIVRLNPALATEKWCWKEVIRQLLYRYEKEVNGAQRSCLKRIQEHDSAPGRPMVLFVSKISEETSEIQEKSGAVVERKSTILELSDGWYRIQAHVDPALARACQRGRLKVGHKLAIMGATRDAQGEGNDVLAAYHLSALVLSSNSTSLAPWDAKLGFSRIPFCASLRSLTPDGGVVAMMDIVITKVYPVAYIDVETSNGRPGAPRGEQEEAEEQELWKKRREEVIARLELQSEGENQRLYDLVEAMGDLSRDTFLPTRPNDPTGKLEALASTLFDQLLARSSPASAVKELVVAPGHSNLAPWLQSLAKAALLSSDSTSSGLGADLDRLCPPRKVREFRIVRFRDARLPPPSPAFSVPQPRFNGEGQKNPHARDVQLTVWDASTFGDELQEGKRFVVTNLTPTTKSAWRKTDEQAEVYLSTRRDTRWRPVV